MNDRLSPPQVKCGICGEKTRMTGTKRCDRCWELETRIKGDPALARKIFESVEPTWKSAKKELPPLSDPTTIRRVLVLCDWYPEAILGWCIGKNNWRIDGSPSRAPVTHWSPLPERRKK